MTAMFLTLTGESKALETDLTKTFGPQEARRLLDAESICMDTHEDEAPTVSDP